MDDIVVFLGILKCIFYEVFQDKESLLIQCILKCQEEMNVFLVEILVNLKNVFEVIFVCYQWSIEIFYWINKCFFEDIKKYLKVYSLLKNYWEWDLDSMIEFFKMGIKQGIFRDDVNFVIVNLLVYEQFDLLMNMDICNKYFFFEVYEVIMFIYIWGILIEKGVKVLEDFIMEYRK